MATALPRGLTVEQKANRRKAWRVNGNLYLYEVVASCGGWRYRIPVIGGVPICPCHAGQHRRKCFHAVVVLRRLQRERVPGILC
jgi:hypothetical protein